MPAHGSNDDIGGQAVKSLMATNAERDSDAIVAFNGADLSAAYNFFGQHAVNGMRQKDDHDSDRESADFTRGKANKGESHLSKTQRLVGRQ